MLADIEILTYVEILTYSEILANILVYLQGCAPYGVPGIEGSYVFAILFMECTGMGTEHSDKVR